MAVGCEPTPPGVRRSESIVTRRSSKQYVDTTRFFESLSTVNDATAAGRPTPAASRSTTRRTAMSLECRSVVDEDMVAVDWASLRLVFLVLDVLLLVHRLTKLYVELDRMRLSTPEENSFSVLSVGCAEGISVLPVDGVDPSQMIPGAEPAVQHVANHVGSEAHGLGADDDEADVTESTTNSLYVTSARCGSHSGSNTSTCPHATGSRWLRRRRTRCSPDIVPRYVCLVALLAALFYARTSTMSRGVLWLHGALPSVTDKSPSIFTSAVGRHFDDDVGIDSLSNDFRQLQTFVDFFNRGKSVMISHGSVDILMPMHYW